MKIIIPKEVKIGGLVYTIIQDTNVAHEGSVYGSTHLQRQRIFLEPESTPQKKEQTLIHEIMHAVWNHAGLNSRYKDGENKKVEEEVIDALSHGLFAVFKDNNLFK